MDDEKMTLSQAIAKVQRSVTVPKARYNAFAKFSYRSFEDIVAALKEPCKEAGVAFTLQDGICKVGDRYYVEATCTLFFVDGHGEKKEFKAYAREAEHKSGSDDAQVTGMASSYARKYALCGLFAIDGQSDPDALSDKPEKEPPESGGFTAKCKACGTAYTFESKGQYEEFKKHPGCCATPTWRVL